MSRSTWTDDHPCCGARPETVYRATAIDTVAWFCTLDGVCPAVVDGTVVRRDRNHLTVECSESLVPLLGGWLSRILKTAASGRHVAGVR